jgi:hypothetical protein
VRSNQLIAAFFSIAFLAVIIIPTVLFVVDDSFDTSIVISISEEEQEKGGEKNMDIKSLLHKGAQEVIDTTTKLPQNNLVYCNKVYATPHLNIISPPPDTVI